LWRDTTDATANPWWDTADTMADIQYSPCCGIVVDPFKSGGVPADGGYPGLSAFYNGARSSSIVHIEAMEVHGYIGAISLSTSGSVQQDDSVLIDRCNLGSNKHAVIIGQDQNRAVTIRDVHSLGTHIFSTGKGYGSQTGVMPTIQGGLIDYTKYLLYFDSGRGSGGVSDLFMESVWSLGKWGSGGFPLTFDRCLIKFIRPDTASIPNIDFHLIAQAPVILRGCELSMYSNTGERLNVYASAKVVFDGCALDAEPHCGVDYDFVEFRDCTLRYLGGGPTYGLADRLHGNFTTITSANIDAKLTPGGVFHDYVSALGTNRRYANTTGWQVAQLSAAVTITAAGDGSATLTVADGGVFQVGDWVSTITTLNGVDPGGAAVTLKGQGIGRVETVVGNNITLKGCAKSLVTGSYTVYLYRIPTIRNRSFGDTTSGNANILNVANVSTWRVGQKIRGAGIPEGAYITAIVGTTVTISTPATATTTLVHLYDAFLELTGSQRWATGAPASGSWWKGDMLKAHDVGGTYPDANGMMLTHYLCTTTGTPGTWQPVYASKNTPAT
jgi:hypothetical protein